MKRLSRKPQDRNAPELMSPEALQAQRAPLLEPEELFRKVTLRPPSAQEQNHQRILQEGLKTPEQLFGKQQLAKPGQSLASPQQLDILPGAPQEEIILKPLPEPESPTAGPDSGTET